MFQLDGNCQNGPLGESHGFSILLICTVFHSTVAASDSTDQLSLLEQMPSSLWEKSSTDSGRIQIKIQIDHQNLFPELTNIL